MRPPVGGSSHPVPDHAAAEALGAALSRVGYTDDAITGLLGEDAYDSDLNDAPAHERRLPDSGIATVIRVFFLELPVPTSDLVRALGQRGVEALEQTGLVELGREAVPRARIIPVGGLLVASDRLSTDPSSDPSDYVATYTPTSQLCDYLTPRPHVARALDVGTGPGIHALLAASHSDHVVATDVNERALAYTQLNAALNRITNIECRRGGLFDPVAGETFDLITCNAPFVVSPESRWTYRDAGFRGDELSQHVVRGAIEHLADGGLATLLVSWVTSDEDAPDEHVLEWVERSGCDSWIIATHSASPLDHAATWNAHLAADRDAYAAALDEWTRYLDGLDVEHVTEGAVLLHKRSGSGYTSRADDVDEEELGVADAQIRRAFAARARLAELERPDDLFAARLVPAATLELESELVPGRGVTQARVHMPEGMQPTVETSPQVASLIPSLDGRLTLDDAVRAAGDSPKLRQDALELATELLELGALRFA
jgi:methylase of polypeptide subunit release factors